MHIGVFADIEGSFGIWRMRQCRMGTREWQYGRACLTEDVNHVICGAFDGGASKVTVKDTHEIGFNCLVNKLDSRADYIGGHFIKPSLFGRVTEYDLALYVAIYAASGPDGAFFPKRIYPYRRLLVFIMRRYFGIKTTYFAPKPDPEGAAVT